MFKLPLAKYSYGLGGLMQDMDKKQDTHPWYKVKTKTIKNGDGLTFKQSSSLGSCQNLQRDYYTRNNVDNETNWEGVIENPLEKGENFVASTTFICRHYKFAPICIATCLVRVYYVLHCSKTMTQACILLGTHEHQVVTSPLRESKEIAHNLIRQEYEKTPITTPLAIAMLVSKLFLASKIIGLNHGSQPKLQGDKIDL
jgi:hypothetical protein